MGVLAGESAYFFQYFFGKAIPDPIVEKLSYYYPRVIITPHLGSFTDKRINELDKSLQQV